MTISNRSGRVTIGAESFDLFEGQATDIEIQAKEILYLKTMLNEAMAKHTGQPYEKIKEDTERDFFMSPQEALEYGLVDQVIDRHDQCRRNERVQGQA